MDDDKKSEDAASLLFGQRTAVPFNFKLQDDNLQHHTVIIGPTASGKSLPHEDEGSAS